MTKLVLFVTLLLFCAALGNAHAAASAPTQSATKSAPAPSPASTKKSSSFTLKYVVHNLALRSIIFKVEANAQNPAHMVVAQKTSWTAIGPLTMTHKNLVSKLTVIVKNYKGKDIVKTLIINLRQRFRYSEMVGQKLLVIEAVESWSWLKGNYILIKINHKPELEFKL
ncbi:uncharacterized protein [Physcomitrium patens]|uniref:Uncharacterized protein n=1 Tax=Physcomitrium patens TaxID=3218 RepID=A0A7I3Z978_PHYPA|nr:uncharacterized protein LOC112295706 [Physcomitrium patens]|eukprot:XP_024403338.1 uncharacterized protein LOC112295706 [Physcomitrella patens]